MPIRRPAITPTRRVTTQAPQAPIPQFTPGALDPEAQAALNDLNSKYQGLTGLLPGGGQVPGAIGQYQYERNNTLRDLAAQRVQALFDRGQGYERVTNDAAGRGFYNSGVRTKGLGDVAGQTQLQLDQLFNQENDAGSLYDRQMAQAAADQAYNSGVVTRGSDDRGYTNFLQNQPLPVPQPAPVTRTMFTFPQWMSYHKNAKTQNFPTDLAALKIRYNNYVTAHSK